MSAPEGLSPHETKDRNAIAAAVARGVGGVDGWVPLSIRYRTADLVLKSLADHDKNVGREAIQKFLAEAQGYLELRRAATDRHARQDADGWSYVVAAAEEHIADHYQEDENDG